MNSFEPPPEMQRNDHFRFWRMAFLASIMIGFLLMGAIQTETLQANDDDLSQLKKRWTVEAGTSEFIQVQSGSCRLLTQGLKYAASKLCPGDQRKKLLESNAQLLARLNSLNKTKQKTTNSLQSAAKHLVNAQKHSSNPSRFKLEISLAKDDLSDVIDRNRQQAESLKEIYGQIIRSEVQYQQVLADCLLGDFMSIFGEEVAPKPEPDVPDDLPDESLDRLFFDDGLGGFDDSEFGDPEFEDPEINQSELFDPESGHDHWD